MAPHKRTQADSDEDDASSTSSNATPVTAPPLSSPQRQILTADQYRINDAVPLTIVSPSLAAVMQAK